MLSCTSATRRDLQTLIKNHQTVGSVCWFSIRHEFPSQWAFQIPDQSSATTAELQLTLVPELYPFWAQVVSNPAQPVTITGVESFAQMPLGDTTATLNLNDKADESGNPDILVKNPLLGNLLSGSLTKIALPAAVTGATPFTLYFDDNSMEDLWITWGT
jgi:hypothetical protein